MSADELQTAETDAIIRVHKHVSHILASYATGFRLMRAVICGILFLLGKRISSGHGPLGFPPIMGSQAFGSGFSRFRSRRVGRFQRDGPRSLSMVVSKSCWWENPRYSYIVSLPPAQAIPEMLWHFSVRRCMFPANIGGSLRWPASS